MPELVETFFTASQSHDDYTSDTGESVFGGELDTWGHTWTPADLNSSEFAVVFDGSEMTAGIYRVDSIEVEVFYTLPQGEAVTDGLPAYAATMTLAAAAIGPGRIVAVGRSGKIVTSDDQGGVWTERESGVGDNLWGVAYGDGRYVAVGENGTVLVSTDGATWSREDAAGSDHFYAVAFNPVRRSFTAVGRNRQPRRRDRDGLWSVGRI